LGKGDFEVEVEAAVDPARKYFRDETTRSGIHLRRQYHHSEICEEWRDWLYRP